MTEHFIWDVSPVIFNLGALQIRWYSLMFIIGFISGYFMGRSFLRREGQDEQELGTFVNYMVLGTIIGARLGHVLFYQPEEYLRQPWRILMVWEGGLASHGGVIGVLVAMMLFLRRKKEWDFLWLADRTTIPTLLVLGLIRVGNLFNSEIIGLPSNGPWAVIFKRVDDIPRHPTQVYEALSYMVLSLITWILYWKTDIRLYRGRILGIAFVFAFAARFGWEFLKENQVEFESSLPLNLGQLLSIPFMAIGLWLMFRKVEPFTMPVAKNLGDKGAEPAKSKSRKQAKG